jgi:hypothetical protein
LGYLRRSLPHFARFCAGQQDFSLLVALDGDEAETLRFCDEWQVPLLFSDEREGVGMSKNRVVERFPDFDYYFFVEDDVELVDGSVFATHVELSQASGIHHFSLWAGGEVRKPTSQSVVAGHRVAHGLYGSADFSFYTGEALSRVGGWHPVFARYRRWGHTEHSYRLFRAGLAPAPFNIVAQLAETCIWHSPPPVTRVKGIPHDEDQIAAPERELMDEGLRHVPVQTLSPHHLNRFPPGCPRRLALALDRGELYPLVERSERRKCRSSYQLWRSRNASNPWSRAAAFVAAVWNWPANPALRHALKEALKRRRSWSP